MKNYTEECFATLKQSSELSAVGRRALALGWTIALEREGNVARLIMRHYTQHYTKEYPSFSLLKDDDVRRWIDRCAAEVDELDRTKWGQYEGWEQDLPKHCQEARRGRTK